MDKNGTVLGQPFVRLEDTATIESQEILGITLDPDFPANHFVYAFTRLKDTVKGNVLAVLSGLPNQMTKLQTKKYSWTISLQKTDFDLQEHLHLELTLALCRNQ